MLAGDAVREIEALEEEYPSARFRFMHQQPRFGEKTAC
jgi:hypothetical protein